MLSWFAITYWSVWIACQQLNFSFGINKTMCMVAGHIPFKILGTAYSSNLSYASNTKKGTQACRKAMYSLVGVGCTYPGGLSSDAKTYLRKSVGLPSLLYNLQSTSIPDICMIQLEKSEVQSRIDKATISLWYRIFQMDLLTRLVCAKLFSDFILYVYSLPGTLIDRIIKMKLSPVKCLFRRVIPNVIEEAHHDSVVERLSRIFPSG